MTSPERIALHDLLRAPGASQRLASVADAVRKGAVFVYPTETIYGIGGLCTLPDVNDRILKAKGRPASRQMILIAAERSSFKNPPLIFPDAAERLARAFWPGKLTLVLPSGEGADRSIAIRVSEHPFINALFRHIDTPLFSTSANSSGNAYVNDPDAIFRTFAGSIDFMIDAGPLPPSPPSTIVKVEKDGKVSVLRSGAVSENDLLKVISL